jgi:hypothetical protein
MKRRNIQHTSRPSFNAEAGFESGRRCDGVSKIERYWWGIEIWLNDCDTGAMTTAMNGAAKVGAPACGFAGPMAPLCGVLVAAIGFGYPALIDAVNRLGGSQGVIITMIGADFPPSGTDNQFLLTSQLKNVWVPLSDALNQAMAKIRQATVRP